MKKLGFSFYFYINYEYQKKNKSENKFYVSLINNFIKRLKNIKFFIK